MKISREAKTGTIAVVILLLFIWGFNFLKGIDVFNDRRVFFAEYENVDGLTKGRPVTLNGFQVGTVSEINFKEDNSGKLVVKLEISNDFPLSTRTELRIDASDLMGSKLMTIDIKNGRTLAKSGDTLKGVVEPALSSMLNKEVIPIKNKLNKLMNSLESASKNIENLTGGSNGKNIENVIVNLNKSLYNFASIMDKNNGKVQSILTNVDKMTSDLSLVTDSLSKANIASLVKDFNNTVSNFNTTLEMVNNGNGSMSKLIKDKELYDNLAKSTKELNELLEDIKLNPDRYIHISLFGKKNKPYKKPE
ncbi:MAG: MCE family protein [Ichthyobacteriaceae bacterium]|nr:MCE family protein [Ichthyobacteriaceae bacterium]